MKTDVPAVIEVRGRLSDRREFGRGGGWEGG